MLKMTMYVLILSPVNILTELFAVKTWKEAVMLYFSKVDFCLKMEGIKGKFNKYVN